MKHQKSSFVVHSLKTAFNMFVRLIFEISWAIYLLDSVTIFVNSSSHYIFFHLKLQATVVSGQSFILPIFVFSHHKRRVAFLSNHC